MFCDAKARGKSTTTYRQALVPIPMDNLSNSSPLLMHQPGEGRSVKKTGQLEVDWNIGTLRATPFKNSNHGGQGHQTNIAITIRHVLLDNAMNRDVL